MVRLDVLATSGSTIGPESPAMPDFETVRIRAPYDAQAVYRGETRHFSVDETFEVPVVALSRADANPRKRKSPSFMLPAETRERRGRPAMRRQREALAAAIARRNVSSERSERETGGGSASPVSTPPRHRSRSLRRSARPGDARRQRERCSPAGPLPPPLRRKRPRSRPLIGRRPRRGRRSDEKRFPARPLFR